MKKRNIFLITCLVLFTFLMNGCGTITKEKTGISYSKVDFKSLGSDDTEKGKLKKVGLEYTSNGIYFDGEPIYLWSAEFQYYRINPKDWDDRLEKLKQSGVKFVTSYIPWNQHEYEEGKFDFTGKLSNNDRRDLVGFIELLSKKGLYFIPKPGPFICGEISHGGIPDWLTDKHPEIIMKNEGGENYNFRQDAKPLPDFLDPTYLDYVSKWYAEISKQVFSKYQYPNGPIVAMQVENEILYSSADTLDPFSWGYTDNTKLLFQQWLKDKYKDINSYNTINNTKINDLSNIEPPKSNQWKFSSNKDWVKFQDWMMFKEYYVSMVLGKYSEFLRKDNVTVPLYHNVGNVENEGGVNFGEMAKNSWIGVNYWLSQDPATDYESYVQGIRRAVELRGSQPDKPSMAPEMNWGWGSADGFDFLTRYTMPFLKGSNIFTIADSNNAGFLNGKPYSNNPEPYPGSSPISVDGTLTPAYDALTRMVNYTNNEAYSIGTAQPESNISLGFYTNDNYIPNYTSWGKEAEVSLKKQFSTIIGANQFLQDFMKKFIENDMEYNAVDIQRVPLETMQKSKLLIVLSNEEMDDATQKKLTQYVENGGKLIILPTLPSIDINMEKSTTLKDTLFGNVEIKAGERIISPENITWKGYDNTLKGGYIVNTIQSYGSGYKVTATTKDGKALAVEKSFGKGKAIYVGTYITDANFYEWLAKDENLISKFAYSDNKDVEVVPITNSSTKDIFLFVTNRGKNTQNVQINYLDVFNQNKQLTVNTAIASASVSIIKVNNGNIVSASLNGDYGAYVTMNGSGMKLTRATKADLSWLNKDKLQFSADAPTGVELDFSSDFNKKSFEIKDSKGNIIPYEFQNGTLKFKYEPNENHNDYCEISIK